MKDKRAVIRLGAPYRVFAGNVSPFRLEVAKRIAAITTDAGLPADWPVPADERARVRTEAGSRWTPGSWPGRSRGTRGRSRPQWPAMTALSLR